MLLTTSSREEREWRRCDDGASYVAVLVYWLFALTGALFGVVAYVSGARRRFTSESSLRATRHDVMADETVAALAREAADRSRT
jgi:hypothetical protein